MPEGAPFEDDDLLLELMDRNKPHLRPYAYRLSTWTRVLEEYNKLTNNHYRQVRTLKKRFERLKGMYEDDVHKVLVSDVKRLERLVNETDRVGKSSRVERGMLKVRRKERNWQRNREAETADLNIPTDASGEDDCESNAANTSENSQPPPLDSITVGFPHNASSPRPAVADARAHDLIDNIAPETQRRLAAAPCPSAQHDQRQQKPHHFHRTHDPCDRNMDLLDKFFESAIVPPSVSSNNPNSSNPSGIDTNNLTLENFYLEFKQYKKSQEEFRREFLHKLDVLIETIKKG